MQDPGFGVSRDLIQHVHLLSTYRYPMLPQLHHEKVAQLLLAAPKIARDQAPFYWTYLDRPATGTILLTWQPQNILGTDFSSDGFIWAPGETAYQMDVNVEGGVYTLEMYQAKVGYAPGEPYAIHSRKRYRLLPPKFPSPNGQTPDPSLWIVHYSDATQQDRVPSNVIPVDVRTNTIMSTRQYLQSQGQIVQKEFMLHDRASWPQIQFPRGGTQRGPQMYGGNQPPVRVPQTMAYPPQHAAPGPPPSKRARTQNNAGPSTTAVSTALDVADDDEDTSRGDIFDVLTPREISTERYMLNHRWMEEILSSPYSIHQIIPPDLGLGLKGELANLTEGVFDAPFVIEPTKRIAKYNYVGQLDGDKADEFRKRAAERIAQTNSEIEKMKAKHAKRLAKFKKGSIVTTAEKELRTAVNDPTDVGPEYWRLEGKIDEEDGEDGKAVTRVPSKVDDILAQVVESLGKHTEAVQDFRRIQDGGFEEPPAVRSPPAQQPSRNGSHQSGRSGHLIGDADVEMGESSAAGLLDQFNPGPSSTSTPGSNAILNMLGRVGTPGSLSVHSPQPAPASSTPQPSVQLPTTTQPDVSMSNSGQTVSAAAPAESTGTGDWVVVPHGGVSPAPSATTSAQNQQTASAAASAAPTPQPAPPATTSNETPNETTTSTDAISGFEGDSNDFGDLGDLDTAGDALAGYGGEEIGGDLGDLGVDMDMGMDDSAFGEAFHGVETRGADGETGDGDGDGI